MNAYTRQDLSVMQAWPLDRKIRVTQAKIIEWYHHYGGKVAVSFSGGKDSTVLLDLARRAFPDIPAVFVDTGLEYPEIREFVKTVPNVTWLRPEMPFSKVISEYGYPVVSKDVARRVRYPYVWGGSSPATSFDCSGFVSYVYNNCGVGWSFGRLGAEGLRQLCTRVSAANLRPGDLVFFQGTYDTTGASHVGIYVGNNMMLHCGDPIQYASLASSYWQSHFLAYGRVPAP